MQTNGDAGGEAPSTENLESQHNEQDAKDARLDELSDNSFASGNKYDEKTLNLENRDHTISHIWNKSKAIDEDKRLELFDMMELKLLCNQILDEDRFDVKCFQTDKALTYMDLLRDSANRAEDDLDLNRAYEYSQDLYQVIYPKKDKIFGYNAC